ncbi:MAG: glutamate-1-semialdehyde 2,1-aminomutase, partial [Bdellovibrionota bacterium]
RRVPSMERMRFVSSGTEATMSALRLARGATGRPKILKFEGCYHGHGDSLLVKAGSGALTFGAPDSAGVLEDLAQHTLVAPYNDLDSVRHLMEEHGHAVAAVIVEPVAGNMGLVPPAEGFLQGLRGLCDQHGALFIFDEVMTGFRVHPGGAQALYKIRPDLTCLGKIVGGGMPLAVYGGRADLLSKISPEGPVYQAGTLSGNPLAVAAGLATLEALKPADYKKLERLGALLEEGLSRAAAERKIPAVIQRVGSMFTLFFAGGPVRSYDDVMKCDAERYGRFFRGMLDRGVYLAPSPYEACFIGLAHTERHVRATLAAARESFSELD